MIQKIPGLIRFSGDWKSICYEMDLGNPIWLESTIKHFKKHGKARFYQDNFIEQIDFDYLEIQVIEEDDDY